jgi:putative membrane protein insertion efficiency factor
MISKAAILAIRAYRVAVSPLLGPCCRFDPPCSVYCIEAIQAHGCLRGLWLGLRRLCRCHPMHPGGLDPVPPRLETHGRAA